MDMRTFEEIGELIMLHQLLKLSSEKTRRILEREENAARDLDRARLEKIAVGLDAAEDNIRCLIRMRVPTKKAPPEGGA